MVQEASCLFLQLEQSACFIGEPSLVLSVCCWSCYCGHSSQLRKPVLPFHVLYFGNPIIKRLFAWLFIPLIRVSDRQDPPFPSVQVKNMVRRLLVRGGIPLIGRQVETRADDRVGHGVVTAA